MIPAILAVLFAIVAVALFIRMAAMTAKTNEIDKQLTESRREAKKLGDKLDDQSQKYAQKAQEASTSGSKAKDTKQRVAQLSEELSSVKTEQQKGEDRIKELAHDLKRVRMDREKLRQEIDAARQRLTELGQSQAELEALKAKASAHEAAAAAPAPVAAPAAEPQVIEVVKADPRIERELDQTRRDAERLDGMVRRLKRAVVEREVELRQLRKKNEDNRRAYIITQLQLDLLNDELYVIKHGHPPELKQADKAAKRAALKPQGAPQVTVDPNAEIINLMGVGGVGGGDDDDNETGVEDEVTIEVDVAAVEAETDALANAEDAPVAPQAEAAPATPAAPAAAAAPAAPEAAATEAKVEGSKPILRKAATATDEAKGDGAPPRPAAPPRPQAPPRPGK